MAYRENFNTRNQPGVVRVDRRGAFARYVVLVVFLIWTVFPIIWLVMTSLKQPNDIITVPPRFIFDPTFDNYRYVFEKANFGLFIRNTLWIAVVSSVIVTVLATLAAYGFARFNVGRGELLLFILSTHIFPGIAVVLPYFIIFRDIGKTSIGRILGLGLTGSGALIIAYVVLNLPLAIWLMVSFIQDIPLELEEAALVDGCTRWQALVRIIIPVALPGIAVSMIFSLLASWNEYLFASVLARGANRTITEGVVSFYSTQGVLWGPMAAAATISMVPMLVFVLLLQRYIVRGLTFGAVRG